MVMGSYQLRIGWGGKRAWENYWSEVGESDGNYCVSRGDGWA